MANSGEDTKYVPDNSPLRQHWLGQQLQSQLSTSGPMETAQASDSSYPGFIPMPQLQFLEWRGIHQYIPQHLPRPRPYQPIPGIEAYSQPDTDLAQMLQNTPEQQRHLRTYTYPPIYAGDVGPQTPTAPSEAPMTEQLGVSAQLPSPETNDHNNSDNSPSARNGDEPASGKEGSDSSENNSANSNHHNAIAMSLALEPTGPRYLVAPGAAKPSAIFASPSTSTSQASVSKKTHPCTVCDKTYATSSGLQRHLESHKGTKYKCGIEGCSKMLMRYDSVIRHIKKVHVGKAFNVIRIEAEQADSEHAQQAN
ncbi:uncharacterized protein HMPREF1541_02687 [Cyphellophora europaea CBS 101466]|uniref:C2H2-type domain-containing protein n=1 Tax=Cyphellophora europaea (strain CBS 101466) TaxID=1220924 RepID=W2S670_CYPE1|nr:uncharacterized protein HMPREF1541_02687 [Cyphellophora europaea CBS 101466]ETN43528.1 hypothetical protein HMPREF1541_02687 [Cyphellophora europaea CBS 101466]